MTGLEAETVLFTADGKFADIGKLSRCRDTPKRRRVDAARCPRCGGWVEVRLRPVRLRCVRCGLEAKP